MKKFTEKMLTLTDLFARWKGLQQNEIARGMDAAISEDPFVDMSDFPKPYRLEKILRDGSGNIIAYCISYKKHSHPYFLRDGYGNESVYEWDDVVFRLKDVEFYEANNPDVMYEIISPEEAWVDEFANDYIPASIVMKHLKMSPIQFIDMLNARQGPRLVTSWEEWYRSGSSHWFETDNIEKLTIHRSDLQLYLQERVQQIESVPNIDFSAVLKPSYADLESQLAEIGERLEKALVARDNYAAASEEALEDLEELRSVLIEKESRIAELEEQLADVQKTPEALSGLGAILEERDALISELQSELGTLRKLVGGYGALSLIVGMLEAGSTKEDIAKHLKEKVGLSYSQVGVLLHENPLNVGASAITMCAKRLLGIGIG